jgi:hypothetical protein
VQGTLSRAVTVLVWMGRACLGASHLALWPDLGAAGMLEVNAGLDCQGHGPWPLYCGLICGNRTSISWCSGAMAWTALHIWAGHRQVQAKHALGPMTAPSLCMPRVQSLTIHCSSQYEEANGVCFSAFPEVLFKLKGLGELAFTSKGPQQFLLA